MMLKSLAISLVILISFGSGCPHKQTRVAEKTDDFKAIQDLSGQQISRLKSGVTVRFPARLVTRIDDCIHMFAQDDFHDYGSDEKFAIPSKLVFTPSSDLSLDGSDRVVVTGAMTFVKDEENTRGTCDIITGNIFEISKIESFQR